MKDDDMRPMENNYLEFLQTLVQLETESGNLDAQYRLQSLCIDFVEHQTSGVTISRGSNYPWTLLTTGSGPTPVMFVCHTDTVPTGNADTWSSHPFDGAIDAEQGTLHGRGSVDMKGGLVAALTTLIRANITGADVAVLLTADEEIGSKGAAVAAEELDQLNPALIIVPEATNNQVSLGHRGALWVRVEAQGVAAHGSRPHTGVNAIKTLVEGVVDHLDDFPASSDEYLGRETVNLGYLSGGSVPNIVPDHAELSLDFRTVGDPQRILDWLHGLQGDLRITELINLPPVRAGQAPTVLQDYPPAPAAPYFTDGSVLQDRFPDAPIVIWGPGDPAMMHAIDETLDLSSLDTAIEHFWRVVSDSRR